MTTSYKARWAYALQQKKFKQLTFLGIFFLIIILLLFPYFFTFIEQREGKTINDIVLNYFTPINVSGYIFGIIWLMAFITIIRCIQQPAIFLQFLWGFILLSISRVITIIAVPLNAPNQLIVLIDPISNYFYGKTFITKDLFYSGHTATLFLMCLCLKNKWDKFLTLLSTIIIGILVLVQHVHYTIDVVAAPFFTYFIYVLTNKITATSLKSFTNLKV